VATGLPFGVAEVLEAAGRPRSALDIGCGSGRLTVELARRGAAATGIDTSEGRLAAARERAAESGAEVTFAHGDMNERLAFADAAFAAVTSRLSLMIARDPLATLREAGRVTAPGGAVVTAVWARIEENPWFGEPRAAAAEALGPLHRRAGLADVQGDVLRDDVSAADAGAHWRELVARIGHYTRLDAAITPGERARVLEILGRRLAPFHAEAGLRLPRAMVIVSARR
jgi:SAM-dependent methyltransferase